jgi:DNA-binding NarL/FixJ family response regulator
MLSPREVEVLKLVGKGLKSKEIADELYLSVRTIHSHRRKICSKLNIKGRHGLVKWPMSTRNGDFSNTSK